MTTPAWLTNHQAELRLAYDGHTWIVGFNGEPRYRLEPFPAGGTFSCALVETVNGRRLDSGQLYPDADAAVQGELETLRVKLGW